MDRQKLYDDLTDAFIKYQHRLDNPMPDPNESNVFLIEKYRTDPIFHTKVNNLVHGVMEIVSKHA